MVGHFIAIQIPGDLRERIADFCKQHQYMPLDPYIVLISPALLTDIQGLEQKLQSFCLAQLDYKLTIAAPNCLNNEILYLTVMPGNIHLMRERLIKYLKTSAGEAVYRPHLTFMRQQNDHPIDLSQMMLEARKVFSAPYTFEVSEITLFVRHHENTPYKPFTTIPFMGR